MSNFIANCKIFFKETNIYLDTINIHYLTEKRHIIQMRYHGDYTEVNVINYLLENKLLIKIGCLDV